MRVSYQYDIICDFIPCLHDRTVHVGQRDGDAILDWMSKTMRALPIPDCWESDFMPEQTVVLHLHDIRISFILE